jgi:hypothetical protein
MRILFRLISLAALAVVAAFAVGRSAPHFLSAHVPGIPADARLDPLSFALGLGAGVVVAAIAAIPWGDLPFRFFSWFSWRFGHVKMLIVGFLCAAVFLYL